jgi:MerR family transcriptional regulator, redox-sensitive transcriptional activator SoxR
MDDLSIGEAARRTGLRTPALRYYEEQGLLPAPRRQRGRRRYDPIILPMIEVLRFAQQAGFTLSEIRTLFHGYGADTPLDARWEELARAKLRELDTLIARAARMKHSIELDLDGGCIRFEDCILPGANRSGDY